MRDLLRISVLLFICTSSSFLEKIDDSIHYYISFTSDATVIKDAPTLDETTGTEDDVVRIISKNNEKFVCKIPIIHVEEKKSLDYSGPTAKEILEKNLHSDKMCSYLIDVYWTYQVCHGRYVIQYHEEKIPTGQLSRSEYYLGNFDASSLSSSSEFVVPPIKRIENEDYPYYSVYYTHGTNCDVTGKPRTTEVVYICVEKVQHKILSVTEVSSCHYEIIIMTDLLCKHPLYRLKENKDHKILCWNEDAKNENEAKPKVLQRLDDFHDSTFKREYTITDEDPTEENDPVVDDKDYQKMRESHQAGYVLSGEKRFEARDSLANNPAVVHHTVNRILTGEDCIVGGVGWWKYEFCYGKHVIQFHEDSSKGDRADILLGSFDEIIHKEWVKENPKVRGSFKDKNSIIQISHLYSKGDLCDETGAHRDVEVRIRCATADHSALAFSMHLTEPSTCQYVLTIDSERFCEPIQYADDFGLIKILQTHDSSTTSKSPTEKVMTMTTEEEEAEEEEDLEVERLHEDL